MNEVAARLAARLFDKPIIENQYRSAFVEAMLEPWLASDNWRYTGAAWCGWDFERSDGVRLEVKQSAARQAWSEAQNKLTKGAFDIAERIGYFSDNGSKWNPGIGRHAHVYVFAWNPGDDHRQSDIWDFFVIPTTFLPKQKTISLQKVVALSLTVGQKNPVKVESLADRINNVLLGLH